MLTSVELAPARASASGSGTLKSQREPVIVLLAPERNGNTLSCAVACFHAGLEPGDYELSDGTRVRVPTALVSAEHAIHPNTTLEVIP